MTYVLCDGLEPRIIVQWSPYGIVLQRIPPGLVITGAERGCQLRQCGAPVTLGQQQCSTQAACIHGPECRLVGIVPSRYSMAQFERLYALTSGREQLREVKGLAKILERETCLRI